MKTNKNIPLTHDERVKVNTIIHTASVATGAMGMVPIGPADTIMITPTQIGMIISLGAIFNIKVSENLAKSILSGLVLSVAGRAVASTLLSFIPVVGWIVKGGTAAALTETIGWTAVAHFHDIKLNHSKAAGKKEGYEESSKEFEKKYRRQAEEFIKKGEIHKSEMEEYSKLIDELTKLLIELSMKDTCKSSKNIELSMEDTCESSENSERIKSIEILIKNLEKLNKVE